MEQLDSLRGLAAFTVLISHFLLVFPIFFAASPHTLKEHWFVCLLTFTPLHIFWCGHEAVIFFFVLSGFVLALPFFDYTRTLSYPTFLIRRFFRIYPPYLSAVILAVAVNVFFFHGPLVALFDWEHKVGQYPTDWRLVLGHASLVGSFDNSRFDPGLWSVVYEMRISILFPVLVYLVRNVNWRLNLLMGFCLGGVSMVFAHLQYRGYLNLNDYADPLNYVMFFIVGAILAKHRKALVIQFQALRKPVKCLFFVAGILAYTHKWWMIQSGLIGHGLLSKCLGRQFISDCGVSLGVSIVIIAALSSHSTARLLTSRVLVFLGRISYSLYLYHAVCLIALLDIGYGIIPIWVILILSFMTAISFSILGFKFVEAPAMAVGKLVSKASV